MLEGDHHHIPIPPFMPPALWVRFDLLVWWMRNQPNPQPLLKDTSLTMVGGAPALTNSQLTPTALGQDSIRFGAFLGERATVGYWLDYDRCFGIEASGFILFQRGVQQQAVADLTTGLPSFARPYFDMNLAAASLFPVSIGGLVTGNMLIDADSKLGGVEGNFLTVLSHEPEHDRISFLWGARYLNLSESMLITTNSNLLPGAAGLDIFRFQGVPLVPPQGLTVLDYFKTRTQFSGPQFGLRGEWFRGRCYFRAQGELAFGPAIQSLNISGITLLTSAPSPQGIVIAHAPGSFLAQVSNIGPHNHTVFSVLPSCELQASYELIPNIWFDLGYTLLAMSDTLRPGLAIDRVLNLSQAPAQSGPIITHPAPEYRPAMLFGSQTFVAQGLNVGIRFTW
jgi:hypothetical protein